jgi:hypothetical protein
MSTIYISDCLSCDPTGKNHLWKKYSVSHHDLLSIPWDIIYTCITWLHLPADRPTHGNWSKTLHTMEFFWIFLLPMDQICVRSTWVWNMLSNPSPTRLWNVMYHFPYHLPVNQIECWFLYPLFPMPVGTHGLVRNWKNVLGIVKISSATSPSTSTNEISVLWVLLCFLSTMALTSLA